MEVFKICQSTFKAEAQPRFWIHYVKEGLFAEIDKNLVIGDKLKGKKKIKGISPNDFIIFFSKFKLKKGQPQKCFCAYTMVDSTYTEEEELYDYYKSDFKVKLKGMKYFEEPIPYKSLIDKLSMFQEKEPESIMKKDYTLISKDDFYKIHDLALISKKFPHYLNDITFRKDDFIIKSRNVLINNFKSYSDKNQKERINILFDFIKGFEVKKITKKALKDYIKKDSKINSHLEDSNTPVNVSNEFGFEPNFWIDNVDDSLFSEIDKNLIIGDVTKGSKKIRDVKSDDFIIFFSTFKYENVKRKCFYAYSEVDSTYKKEGELYGGLYKSDFKVKLKGMKYFKELLPYDDFIGKLSIFQEEEPKNLMKSFNKIPRDDFYKIKNSTSIIEDLPNYLIPITFKEDDFILNSIKALYDVIKSLFIVDHMEIGKFISLLRECLRGFGLKISKDDLESFYARNVYKLGFKHTPSRNANKFVTLYTESGIGADFGYVSFV